MFHKTTESTFYYWVTIAAAYAVGILNITSGIYLISSIFKIRRYLKSKDIPELVNTKQMLLHGGAFGVYLLMSMYYGATLTLVLIEKSKRTRDIYEEATVSYILANFVSQCLLIVIFWELGYKVEH